MRPRFLSGEEKVNSLGSAMAVEAGLFLLVEYLAVMATNLFSSPPLWSMKMRTDSPLCQFFKQYLTTAADGSSVRYFGKLRITSQEGSHQNDHHHCRLVDHNEVDGG